MKKSAGARSGPAVAHRRLALACLALLGLLVALARLPLIRDPVDVSPDGCEYLGIARHLVSEHRWISSLKWHFFTDAPVVHPALADRPPLYPLWAAGWIALSSQPQRQIWLARLGNLLLAAVVPVTLFWALEPAVTEIAAALAVFIFMLYPAFLRNSAQPLTEPLFLLLLFGSLGRFLRAASAVDWFITGLLAGLTFLARPTGILLPVLYVAVLVIQAFRRSGVQAFSGYPLADAGVQALPPSPRLPVSPSPRLPLFLILVGFLLPLVPFWIAVAAQTGSPFTSILRYNYSIRNIDEGTLSGFERTFQPPMLFVWGHAGEVAGLIVRQWGTMGRALGRSLQYLLPLVLFWRPGYPTKGGAGWKQGVLLAFACENFVLHGLSWTVWGAARYLFPTYVIGMALLLDAPVRWLETGVRGQGSGVRGRRGDGRIGGSPFHPLTPDPWPLTPAKLLAAGAIALGAALTLAACVQQDARLYREKSRPYAGVHLGWAYAAAGRYLTETPPGSVCAANQPWIINLLAQRPAVMAPRFRDAAQLRRYLSCYRPATLTLFVTEREPKDVAAASRLVNDLWTHPSLRAGLANALDLRMTFLHVAHAPRQALLIFGVRPAAVSGR